MTAVCWGSLDPSAMLAVLAQVFATLAALNGAFGVIRLQALQEQGRLLLERGFELYAVLRKLTGKPPNESLVKSLEETGGLAFLLGVEKEVRAEALASVAQADSWTAIHGVVAFHRVLRRAHRLPGQVRLTKWIVLVPVVGDILACLAGLAMLVMLSFSISMQVTNPEKIGLWVAASAALLVLLNVASVVVLVCTVPGDDRESRSKKR
jgi:hypothetical protein